MPSFSIILGKVLRHSAMFCFRIQSIESQTLLNALRLCLRRYKNLALDKRYTHTSTILGTCFMQCLYLSGASSFRSATPSPPLSSSTGTSTADEGIVKDLFSTDQMRSSSRPTHHKPVSYFKNTSWNPCNISIYHSKMNKIKIVCSYCKTFLLFYVTIYHFECRVRDLFHDLKF